MRRHPRAPAMGLRPLHVEAFWKPLLRRGCKGRSPCRGAWGVSPQNIFLLLRVSPAGETRKRSRVEDVPSKNLYLRGTASPGISC